MHRSRGRISVGEAQVRTVAVLVLLNYAADGELESDLALIASRVHLGVVLDCLDVVDDELAGHEAGVPVLVS